MEKRGASRLDVWGTPTQRCQREEGQTERQRTGDQRKEETLSWKLYEEHVKQERVKLRED